MELIIGAIILLVIYIICLINNTLPLIAFGVYILLVSYYILISIVSVRAAAILAIVLTPLDLMVIEIGYLDVHMNIFFLFYLFILIKIKDSSTILGSISDNKLMYILAAFVVLSYISAILSPDVMRAVKKATQYGVLMSIMIIVPFIIYYKKVSLDSLIKAWVYSIGVLGIIYLIVYYLNGYAYISSLAVRGLPDNIKIESKFTEDVYKYPFTGVAYSRPNNLGVFANDLASRIVTVIPILMANRNITFRYFLLGSSSLALILTYSRAGYVGLVMGLVLLLISGRWIKSLSTAGAAILTIITLFIAVSYIPAIYQRFTDIYNLKESSSVTRMAMLEYTLELWKTRPWLGVGPGLNRFLVEINPLWVDSDQAPDPHNMFLQILAENGIIGLSCFLLFLIYLLYRGWRRNKYDSTNQTIGIMAGLIGMLVCGFFSMIHTQAFFWCYLGFCISSFCSDYNKSDNNN